MENQISLDKALEITVNLLNGISVPVGFLEQIGIPISRAISNLNKCIEFVRTESELQQPADEPVVDQNAEDDQNGSDS